MREKVRQLDTSKLEYKQISGTNHGKLPGCLYLYSVTVLKTNEPRIQELCSHLFAGSGVMLGKEQMKNQNTDET